MERWRDIEMEGTGGLVVCSGQQQADQTHEALGIGEDGDRMGGGGVLMSSDIQGRLCVTFPKINGYCEWFGKYRSFPHCRCLCLCPHPTQMHSSPINACTQDKGQVES